MVEAPVAEIEGGPDGDPSGPALRRAISRTEQAAGRSLLPGWSRAEVLTHLARNADGGRGIAEAAARDEVGMQYPGGAEQREAGIAAGRGARPAELLADLRRSCDALMDAWAGLPDDAWERPGRSLTGQRTQRGWVWSRWREVEVHHVDLGLGYSPAEWPVAFVTRGLDEAFAELPDARRSLPHPLRRELPASRPPITSRAWIVRLADRAATVDRDDNAAVAADGTISGWGCDVLAWLYGRDPSGAGLTGTGDLTGLRLPEWFPYP